MVQELLAELDRLHRENNHKAILHRIGTLPQEIRETYDIQSRRARALGNLGEYAKALEVLEAVRKEGEQDPLWWYRTGRALFGLDRFREARPCFLQAEKLDPSDKEAGYFAALCATASNKQGKEGGKGNKF